MPENTNLKQALNIVKSLGVLTEKNLKTRINEKGEITGIDGTLTFGINDLDAVVYKVFITKFTKEGKENRYYSGIETVYNTYQSVADVGRENATVAVVKGGELNPNTYFNDFGKQESLQYKASAFTAVSETPDKFYATYEVEMFITSIIHETEDGVDTGRLLVKGLIPLYSGIEPIVLVSSEADARAIELNYSVGDTAKFIGDITSVIKTKTKEIQVAIGKPRTEETSYRVTELIITGVSERYPAEKAYDREAVSVAMVNREQTLLKKKEEYDKKPKTSNSTSTNGTAQQSAPAGGKRFSWG